MLGRLLHLGSGGSATLQASASSTGSSHPILSLESVQEDIHTRNLLFPDAHALYQHRNDQVFPLSSEPATPSAASTNAFDYNDDIELDVRDVRVIVLQDALGPTNASLLFDSHPLPETLPDRSPPRQEPRKAPLSPRRGSQTQSTRPLVIQSDSSQARQGAFDRRASVHSRSHSYAETDAQRAAREYREELATFSSCIFGNSELMAYKGTSTKVHVVPTDSRPTDHAPPSVVGDGRSSIGRSSARSSKLSQSFSSQTVSPILGPPPPPSTTGTSSRQSDKKKVLITRLFPVNVVVDDADANLAAHGRLSDDNPSFPFPAAGDDAAPPKKRKPQPRQRRTPMYAVVLVVQLPRTSSRVASSTPLRSVFREPGSYSDQDFFSSSYSSSKAGWNTPGPGAYADVADSACSIDIEDRIDSLTQHWDIIMRTLTHLQSIVATTIHALLRKADVASSGPHSTSATSSNLVPRTPSWTDRRVETQRPKPSKSTTKLVSLPPNRLAEDVNIASEVALARSRVVMGLGAARVVTGQGRWGIWRDEAIWTSRWAASVDRDSFFCTLLTAFLATHTDWLQALCGPSHRRRAAAARRNRNEEDLSLPARTIVVSDDKMAARRMIFLLSAFLPANQQVAAAARGHRPSTSASLGGHPNSPPTVVVPILREESLRRKINRRTGLRRASHSRTASQSARSAAVSPQFAQLNANQHQRRASDAASVRTNHPMPGQDFINRKSGAATTTTIIPETITTPHFSVAQQQRDSLRRRRPSCESIAADDLKRSLKRSESHGQIPSTGTRVPSQGLKWGTLMSGLWSSRRRESIDNGTAGQGSELRSPVKSTFSRPDKLSEMVQEVSFAEEAAGAASDRLEGAASDDVRSFGASREDSVRGQGAFVPVVDRTPDPTGAFESPVKTSINADDGVIEVDIPFPDYIASFESAISSPSSSGYLSTPGMPSSLEAFDQAARFAIDGDLPLNAAGWLNRFHPDFALQALPPQENLLEKVKAALQAEPTPAPDSPLCGDVSERWVDVSSVVVANTVTNTIKRFVYRRLVRPKASTSTEKAGSSNAAASNFNGSILLTPSILPYEHQLEEEWIQDDISGPDDALRDAIERVVHFTPEASKDNSAVSSQAPSNDQGSTGSGRTIPDTLSQSTQLAELPPEIPRVQCKTVILSTLEEMIREAIDSRDLNGEGSGSYRHGRHRRPNLLRDAIRQWVMNLDSME
ncbi:hypothetical protein DCS_00410 [Drechmeria coniospora]|uniref:Folliculin-interacting protein N-terminal domain-containing protein n=1 Tax=Drechmeria coniospora TaxID=98403 RepID=A0A151GQB4_DRECN|nr:hypothetical protein DCS_00410 [Drechmeria coniospora]KYK59280.1 hypothetical protein DCS_00410 [Drechmeria coniospora]ODA78019.1 hypothetical protein RJ55_06622 [Drechmeria coniospora]